MSDQSASNGRISHGSLMVADPRTKKRNAAEARFRAYGIVAISIGVLFLAALAFSILRSGLPAFTQYVAKLEVTLSQEDYDAAESKMLKTAAYTDIFIENFSNALDERGVDVAYDSDAIERILGKVGGDIRGHYREHPDDLYIALTERYDGCECCSRPKKVCRYRTHRTDHRLPLHDLNTFQR